MLIFTSREMQSGTNPSTFEPHFSARSALRALTNLERAPEGMAADWKVSQADADLDDADALRTWLPLFQKPGPLLVYLHGYNDTPAACFERCDRLQSRYGLEVVRFSWSSRKHLADDGVLPGLGKPNGFASFRGARHGLPFKDQPVVGEPDAPDCAWWLVMAQTGSPPVTAHEH